jgi:hypothetical protein
MAHFTAEDFRSMVNRLNEYAGLISEEDSVPDDNSEPVTNMLTKPAGLQKISGSLDTDALITILEIPSNLQSDFKSAITALQDDNPQLSPGQALALATAFDHLLRVSPNAKAQTLGKIRAVGAPSVTESKEDVTSADTGIDKVVKTIQMASDVSPVSKLQATKLVKYLLNGIKDRHPDGGMNHVMSGIVSAIESAKSGNESEALKHISSMVNHVEGDRHAIDTAALPNIVVCLMLLIGDMLQHPHN